MPLDQRHRDLVQQGDKLFSDRYPLMSLWGEIADHFYPERSHFTSSPLIGRDFAAQLSTSYPIIARRDLGNAFSAMLRPKGKQWFWMQSAYTDDDYDSTRWLQYASTVQRRAMYDRASLFTRATKEGDHDYAAFGQCVLSAEINRARDGMLYRCWHLRDVAWAENAEGKIGCVHRNWEPTLFQLKGTFGDNGIAPAMRQEYAKNPFRLVKVRHIVVESAEYAAAPGGGRWPTGYVSIYIDTDNNYMIEEKPIVGRFYVIPRWQTVSGSQYAFSPATVAALPDGRLLQAMTLTLLQAGERASDPPMVARQGAMRSDLDLRSGGVTWVDKEYDERLGKALSPIEYDHSGIQYGLSMQMASQQMIREAFFLNKISMPPSDHERTATEISYAMQEYIRQALPLFEPMEDDYNGQICDETFTLLMHNGAFGSKDEIPEALRGSQVQFHFESPLLKAEGTQKGAIFNNGAQLLAAAAQVDPDVVDIPDASVALRDTLYGIGWPAKWTRSQDEVAQIAQARQKKQAMAETVNAVHGAGAAAEQVGKGAQALQIAQSAAATGQTGAKAA